MGKIMEKIKNFLKRFLPASSKTVNSRLDRIETKVNKVDRIKGVGNVNQPDLFYLMCKANEIKEVHCDTFLPYKGIHQGQEIVIVGTGPTLQYYTPITDAVHIGVNGAYHSDSFRLDYLFVQDFEGEGKDGVFYIEELKQLSCKKFVGQYIKNVPVKLIAPQYVANYIGAKNYYVHDYFPGHIGYRFPLNIEFYPIVDNSSTIFAAIQFALYTHPKKIYIVGCDCSYLLGQHFDGSTSAPMYFDIVFKNWKLMRDHISTFFPDIEVVSVNPIGLKGLFEDIYTTSYLENNKKQ